MATFKSIWMLSGVTMHVSSIARVAPTNTSGAPYAVDGVQCGFPSPAQDYFDGEIDLNEQLISDPERTHIMTVRGHNMTHAGIFDGDEILVDRGRKAATGDTVVARVDGDMIVCRLMIDGQGVYLDPDNHTQPRHYLTDHAEVDVWGVVYRVLHKLA